MFVDYEFGLSKLWKTSSLKSVVVHSCTFETAKRDEIDCVDQCNRNQKSVLVLNTYVGNEPMVISFNGEVNKNIDFSFGENTEEGFEKITCTCHKTLTVRLVKNRKISIRNETHEGIYVLRGNI